MNEEEVREKIITALKVQKYKGRTISGLVQDTGLERSVITCAFRQDEQLQEIVKVHPRKLKSGKRIFTTKARFREESSFSDRFVDIFASIRPDVALDD